VDLGYLSENVLIAIPVLDEEKNIAKLLFEINTNFPYLQILVVDDGSKDRTVKSAQTFNCEILKHPINKGKGASIKAALSFAHINRFTWLITIDGDNQHPPENIKHFLELIKNESIDLIIANRRDRRGKMPIHRQLSNAVTSILISILGGGIRIKDSQCGYRAYRVEDFHVFATTQLGFHFESETLLKALKSNLNIAEIEIATIYANQKSSIRLLKETITFIKLLLHYIIYS
jgi:glycosyltransferase involved in cell wall biosynthesis